MRPRPPMATCLAAALLALVASAAVGPADAVATAVADTVDPGVSTAPRTGPAVAVSATLQQLNFLGSKAHEGTYKLVGGNSSSTTATPTGGVETKLAGLDVYLAAPPAAAAPAAAKNAPAAPRAAILLFSDIYGWRGNGTRAWADRLASLGYVVAMPDFFRGASAGGPNPDPAARAFIVSLSRQNVTRETGLVLSALRKLYPSVAKIGAYGFCWGGRHATVAAGNLAIPGAGADAAVAYHSALIAPEEFAAISRPLLFVNAKVDPLFNETAVAEAKKAGKRNAARKPAVAVELREYEGVRHGFAARSAPNDTVAVAAAESAFQDGLSFLKRHGVTP